MSLTIRETTPPTETEEVVPGDSTGYMEPYIEPLSGAESQRSIVYTDPEISDPEISEEEEKVVPLFGEIKMEEKVSADPSLSRQNILQALRASFESSQTRSGAYRLEPVSKDVNEPPYAQLLLSALGRAKSKEEHDRIKNSFYSAVRDLTVYPPHRNQINAAIDVYFDNLDPFVDYERKDEFETKEREEEEAYFGSESELEEIAPYGRYSLFLEEGEEEEEEEEKPAEPFSGYKPTKEQKMGPSYGEFKEEPGFKDIGDLSEKLFSGDVFRLLQSEEGDPDFKENVQNVIDNFVAEFQQEFSDEPPTAEQFENISQHIRNVIPNASLRDIMLGELERLRRSRYYEEKELEDLPPHTLQPHSLRYAKRVGEYQRPGRYPTRGADEPTRGISQDEKAAAEEQGYKATEYLTKTGERTVWKGPQGGEWAYNPQTSEFVNVKNQRKILGAEEGKIVEFVRPGPETVPPDELERESARILQQQRRISERKPNYRTNRSKQLGDIKIQWTAGRPQRDIVIPPHTRFEDVVKLAEILRIETGTLVDNTTKESLKIGKDIPISVIISYIQTMLARNVGHELYFLWAPSKKASGLFLGGGLMKYFQKPLMKHKQYHSTPMHRFKEYVAKTPLSAMSRHHRGSGISGAPPGSGWNEPGPTTFQPFAFENAGAYPLPKRSYYDSDALDKDARAMSKPFGTLPPGLGGPYMESQEGIGGQIANREISWREPRGGAKVSDIATGIAGVSAGLAATGIGSVVAAPLAAVSGIVAGIGKIFGF